jgi:GNAT superfamily N-acetyltransferase
MKSEVVVRQAEPKEFERVGHLIYELLTELYPGEAYQRSAFVAAASTLLTGSEGAWSYLATTSAGRDVGVVTLNECAAIYAGSRFGEISEFYVVPDFRSKGVGTLLIEAAISFGRERGWISRSMGRNDSYSGSSRLPCPLRTSRWDRREFMHPATPHVAADHP